MYRNFLAFLLAAPALAFAQNALTSDEARKAEQTMARWLAHPMEFGVSPKRVTYLRSVTTKMAGEPTPVSVNIIEYEMPDGTYGRGLVNPVTWSFLGPIPYGKLTDEQLVTAYSGWLWIFSAISNGRVQTDFEPNTLNLLLSSLAKKGINEVFVSAKYKVGTSEVFEFKGRLGATEIKGAGSALVRGRLSGRRLPSTFFAEAMMSFAIYAGDTLVGHSELELGDPPMDVAFGKFIAAEGYRHIRHECQRNHADQTALALRARSPSGDWLPCAGVGILDYSDHTDHGDAPYVEATVLGIPYPLYGELFPAHVAAYEKQFGGS